jgi:UDP-N-acetylmuramoylalanine--D-glutamate ligase
VGLARSGAAAARMLARAGETVIGVDTGHPVEAAGLEDLGVEVRLDVDGTDLLGGVATVVKSPGVPREAAVVSAARDRGIEVTGELELAWRMLPNPFSAVTGTNGKTTTTELLGHIHRTAGRPVAVVGNIGTPVSSLVGEIEEAATVVCECSSFQLEDTTEFAPECSVFLNLAADHLDRHSSFEAYRDAKFGVFANQGIDDVSIVNGDDPELSSGVLPGNARRVWFCDGGTCEMTIEDGVMRWQGEALIGVDELPLLGRHNVENAMAAAAAALAMGIAPGPVADGLRTFEGVPHRLERVRERNGVLYVNDSKATNVASALAGIGAFEGGLHLILGGSLKGESFRPLAGPVSDRAVAVYLIGAAADDMVTDLASVAVSGVHIERSGSLEQAVEDASAAAAEGEVVLLSPACASFDAFHDFEERGDRFRDLVEALP